MIERQWSNKMDDATFGQVNSLIALIASPEASAKRMVELKTVLDEITAAEAKLGSSVRRSISGPPRSPSRSRCSSSGGLRPFRPSCRRNRAATRFTHD